MEGIMTEHVRAEVLAVAGRGQVREAADGTFDAFVAARWGSLVRTAYLVTADRGTAEDCVQEALAKVHRHWRRVEQGGAAEAYARKAVLNAALSLKRRRRVREVPLDDAGPGSGATRGGADSRTGLDVDLLAALRALPPRMRAVVVLRIVEDQSEAETARLLGCSVGTVKSTTSRGLARLRELLGDGAVTGAATSDERGEQR